MHVLVSISPSNNRGNGFPHLTGFSSPVDGEVRHIVAHPVELQIALKRNCFTAASAAYSDLASITRLALFRTSPFRRRFLRNLRFAYAFNCGRVVFQWVKISASSRELRFLTYGTSLLMSLITSMDCCRLAFSARLPRGQLAPSLFLPRLIPAADYGKFDTSLRLGYWVALDCEGLGGPGGVGLAEACKRSIGVYVDILPGG